MLGLISKNTPSLSNKESQQDLWDTSALMNKPLAPIGGAPVSRIGPGHFVTTTYNLSGGYIPSFQKKEVGSVGQRIQLAPLGHQHALDLSATADSKTGKAKPSKSKPSSTVSVSEISEDYEGWKRRADRIHPKGTSYSALGKNSTNLIARAPPVQPVHGRVDWAAKYGSHR
ncbi:hypothetical protein cypCar_00035882 [Cyprinus carpio]|nr:hypothetical protein cypCar_00035882 [Cyprinus carpio]